LRGAGLCLGLVCAGVYKDSQRSRDLRCVGLCGLSLLYDCLSL
jgi:hypothetical protein